MLVQLAENLLPQALFNQVLFIRLLLVSYLQDEQQQQRHIRQYKHHGKPNILQRKTDKKQDRRTENYTVGATQHQIVCGGSLHLRIYLAKQKYA